MAVENGDIGMLKSLGIKARSSPLHSFFHTFLDHKTRLTLEKGLAMDCFPLN